MHHRVCSFGKLPITLSHIPNTDQFFELVRIRVGVSFRITIKLPSDKITVTNLPCDQVMKLLAIAILVVFNQGD